MAACIAVPTLAMAGALPDVVQRAASKVASSIGVDVPSPRSEEARSRDGATHGTAVANSVTPGALPVNPRDGEQGGNRFGQVPEGPDQGTAGQPRGTRPEIVPPRQSKPITPKPAKDARPASPMAPPAAPTPATPAPATPVRPTAPAAPAPDGGNGSGGAGGAGNANGR